MTDYPTYKLGDVAEIILGQSPESKSYNTKGEGLPFFQGKSEFTDWFPVPNKWCTEPKKIAEPFDILLSVRAPVGPTNVAKEKCCIGRGLAAIRYPECYKYVLYYLRSVSKHLESKATGTTFSSISGDVIRNLSIPLPPLPTQHQIVSRIESLFAELDKAVEHLRTAQQQLKTYRQAVLNHWLNNEDGKWEMVKIESVANVVSGYAFKSNLFKDSGKYQIIRIGNIRPGIIRINESPVYYDEIPSGTGSKVLLKKKDVIITLTGTRKKRDYGYTAMVTQENLLLNQRLAYFRFDNKQYEPAFFLYYSWTDSFKDNFFSYETGNVGQGNVGIKAITKTEIPIPPLPEQQRIVEEIETRLSQAEAAEARIAEALQKTEALRQSILKKAFSGKLV